jgi:hypothetical protein
VQSAVATTSWLATYLSKTLRPDGSIDPASMNMRVCLFHPQFNYQTYQARPNKCIPAFSMNCDEGFQLEITGLINRAIKTRDEIPDFGDHLTYHVALTKEIMKGVSEVDATVTPTFQVAVHTMQLTSGISEIISDESTFTLNLELTYDPQKSQ